MNTIIFIFLLLLLTSCGSHMKDGRFDHTNLFPTKNTQIIVDQEVDLHFGPGPMKSTPKEEEHTLQEKPKVVPTEENEPENGWWIY